MKILTIGPSPYLLNRFGRIHADLIRSFRDSGSTIASVVWDHDTTYFMDNESDGKHYFESVELFPLAKSFADSLSRVLDRIRRYEPTVAVSVSGPTDMRGFADVCAASPKRFAWVAVVAAGPSPVDVSGAADLRRADRLFVTSRIGAFRVSEASGRDAAYRPYGPRKGVNPQSVIPPAKFRAMSCAKNCEADNPLGFVDAVSEADVSGYLHTNLYDGDFDIRGMIRDLEAESAIALPTKYVSEQEGVSDDELRDEFAASSVVVDLAADSATGLSVLEGMANGCVPLVTRGSVASEVVEQLPLCDRFMVSAKPFFKPPMRKLLVADPLEAAEKLRLLYLVWKDHRDEFANLMRRSAEIARGYLNQTFVEGVCDAARDMAESRKPTLAVEIFSGVPEGER